jgi:hypothetical protein
VPKPSSRRAGSVSWTNDTDDNAGHRAERRRDLHRSPRSGLVLVALVLVAAVANLNLSVANVVLPDIGKAFNSSQTSLDLIAVG